MRKFILCGFLLCSSTVLGQSEEPVLIQNGFITGNQYKAMKLEERTTYLMGVVDGLFLSPFLKAPSSESRKVKICVARMNNTQIRAIIDKYLDARPERWHQGMHTIFWGGLNETCSINS